jgi:hypothetical protein
MEACLEALLEIDFCTKPPNFGVEAHMEAPAGDALRHSCGHVRVYMKFEAEVTIKFSYSQIKSCSFP